jgi:hypothetical protein
MERKNDASRQINEIHQMMQRSSKFISLSGLSGISAGLTALAGVAVGFFFFNPDYLHTGMDAYRSIDSGPKISPPEVSMAVDGIIVLIVALASSIFFTTRKARKNGLKVWDNNTLRLLSNLFLPLMAGGIFCLALYYYGMAFLVPPSTLVFYGLALIHAGKYTFEEVRMLGALEVLLGLISLFLIRYCLLFWAAGFGLLHIIYGSLMYSRYERTGEPRAGT